MSTNIMSPFQRVRKDKYTMIVSLVSLLFLVASLAIWSFTDQIVISIIFAVIAVLGVIAIGLRLVGKERLFSRQNLKKLELLKNKRFLTKKIKLKKVRFP